MNKGVCLFSSAAAFCWRGEKGICAKIYGWRMWATINLYDGSREFGR
jgi:hypothetical protein